MDFPIKIKPGFDFDEAITMAELSRRVYRVFESEEERDPRQVYNVLYRDDWEMLHAVRDYRTEGRCLILKRKGHEQFAIVFRGSIVTGAGLELTNFAMGGMNVMDPYEPVAGEYDAALLDARIHRGNWQTFVSLKNEIDLFFSVLVFGRVTQRDVAWLSHADSEARSAWAGTVAAAIRARYGETAGERVQRTLNKAMQQVEAGDRQLADIAFDDLIQQGARLESVLDSLMASGATEQASAAARAMDVYVTGHSLGGALAVYCALYLQRVWRSMREFPPVALKVYTVGSVKVGNQTFATHFNREFPDLAHRVENQLDPAIRSPQADIPLVNRLQLLLPGVNYVREGDNYYANYEHVGEAYSLINVGFQNTEINFGGPLRIVFPIPFPHGPDGYKEMLIRARDAQERFWKPVRTVMRAVLEEQNAQLSDLQRQMADLRATVAEMAAQQSAAQAPDASRRARTDPQLKAMQQQLADLQTAVDALLARQKVTSDTDTE